MRESYVDSENFQLEKTFCNFEKLTIMSLRNKTDLLTRASLFFTYIFLNPFPYV